MRIEGERFGIKTGKTLRRAVPSKKMTEMEQAIQKSCIVSNGLQYIYNDHQIVSTNEQFEQIDKNRKR